MANKEGLPGGTVPMSKQPSTTSGLANPKGLWHILSRHYPQIMAFSQHDNRWKNKLLGRSPYNMGSSGCLVTSVAYQLWRQKFRTHPGMFVDWLNANGGFLDPLGYLIFDSVRRYTRGQYLFINNDATNKLCTLIEGYLYFLSGKRTKHWVAKVGGAGPDGSEMIVDPNDKPDPKPKALGQFKNFFPTGRRAYIRRG